MKRKRIFLYLIALILVLSGCNVPETWSEGKPQINSRGEITHTTILRRHSPGDILKVSLYHYYADRERGLGIRSGVFNDELGDLTTTGSKYVVYHIIQERSRAEYNSFFMVDPHETNERVRVVIESYSGEFNWEFGRRRRNESNAIRKKVSDFLALSSGYGEDWDIDAELFYSKNLELRVQRDEREEARLAAEREAEERQARAAEAAAQQKEYHDIGASHMSSILNRIPNYYNALNRMKVDLGLTEDYTSQQRDLIWEGAKKEVRSRGGRIHSQHETRHY